MTDKGQCPECNQWSDRSDDIKRVVSETNLTGETYFACLNPTCEVYLFEINASGQYDGLRLNLDGIYESGKSVIEVKKDKLSHYTLE